MHFAVIVGKFPLSGQKSITLYLWTRLTSISDSLTKTQDFIISPIEGKKQLYVAYGGSFHGWKFLPIIGGYVVDMIEGKLEESWKQRWSGKFESEDRIHQSVIPKRALEKF